MVNFDLRIDHRVVNAVFIFEEFRGSIELRNLSKNKTYKTRT